MHLQVEPSLLYLGTPVVLLTTINADDSPNVAPMSSAWWLGWSCMLGLGSKGQSARNLQDCGECVLNLPDVSLVERENRLARLTGSNPVPQHKAAMGYAYERDKFSVASLATVESECVSAVRVKECPVQLEAVLEAVHPFGHRPDKSPGALAFEVRVVRAHVDDSILKAEKANHIDPDLWRPLMMSFGQFYGLGERLAFSTLAEIPEQAYRPSARMER